MRKFFLTLALVGAFAASASAQNAPTLRVVTEDPRLPSELFYGNTRVKPTRVRPGTNTAITINDADFFVQQQYVDFLGRFPDQEGFSFWINQITGCGSNANCTDGQRTNTSGSFYLSIEFQETGYLVYRLHKASFGRRPLYTSFAPEQRQVANGVIVGQGNWQALLEANKTAFSNSWVNRPDFLAEYPTTMTPAAYVDKIIQTAGLSAGQVNRDALVAGLTNGTETRATALRKIVESEAFAVREKNPAFVHMQYLGYLRRDPDEAGFNFWLGKLNNHNGDFHAAEMVRSFLVSGEYLGRF
ncbi:MAG TPA: DUF4214 domain-containing protein [Pyrinomonadaceae bacterium]|nr:DUF4214 domain-containing protein [Pyrinomonadaceae bacterium]